MNSSADIKAFCGRHGGDGLHLQQRRDGPGVGVRPEAGRQGALLPRPAPRPQHRRAPAGPLPRRLRGVEPAAADGGLTAEELRDARMILWQGHCSVHGRFSADVVDELRAKIPGVQILVHPECTHEVVLKADLVGSTEFIIKTIEAAPAGSSLGDRHRAQPGQAAGRRPPRQADLVPRPERLLLLDDEPDRPAPPGVGPGVAGRRHTWSTGSRSTPRPSAGPGSRCSGCSTCPASRTATDRLDSVAGRPGARTRRWCRRRVAWSRPMRAAVRADDPAAGGQPDPGAGLRTVEPHQRLEGPLAVLLGDAAAAVGDLDPPAAARPCRRTRRPCRPRRRRTSRRWRPGSGPPPAAGWRRPRTVGRSARSRPRRASAPSRSSSDVGDDPVEVDVDQLRVAAAAGRSRAAR